MEFLYEALGLKKWAILDRARARPRARAPRARAPAQGSAKKVAQKWPKMAKNRREMKRILVVKQDGRERAAEFSGLRACERIKIREFACEEYIRVQEMVKIGQNRREKNEF